MHPARRYKYCPCPLLYFLSSPTFLLPPLLTPDVHSSSFPFSSQFLSLYIPLFLHSLLRCSAFVPSLFSLLPLSPRSPLSLFHASNLLQTGIMRFSRFVHHLSVLNRLSEPFLQSYPKYHHRYLELDCEKHHNTQFFHECCHPRLVRRSPSLNLYSPLTYNSENSRARTPS
jgi:hypothetical protein